MNGPDIMVIAFISAATLCLVSVALLILVMTYQTIKDWRQKK